MGPVGSVSVIEAVPLVRKRRRAWLGDFTRRGAKVQVAMKVPVTFMSQDLFHAWRMLSLPAWRSWSKAAPALLIRVSRWVCDAEMLSKACWMEVSSSRSIWMAE